METNRSIIPASPVRLKVRWTGSEPFGLTLVDKSSESEVFDALQLRNQAFPESKKLRASVGLIVSALIAGAGCSGPSVAQQRLVAKNSMTFSGSSVFAYNSSRLLPQLASGFGSSGGAQNSGCTSCR